jgi:hypothetical protein
MGFPKHELLILASPLQNIRDLGSQRQPHYDKGRLPISLYDQHVTTGEPGIQLA